MTRDLEGLGLVKVLDNGAVYSSPDAKALRRSALEKNRIWHMAHDKDIVLAALKHAENGVPITEIARICGLKYGAVYRWINDRDAIFKRLDEEDVKAYEELSVIKPQQAEIKRLILSERWAKAPSLSGDTKEV